MIIKCSNCGFKIEVEDSLNDAEPLEYKCPQCGYPMVADEPRFEQHPQNTIIEGFEPEHVTKVPFQPKTTTQVQKKCQPIPPQQIQDAIQYERTEESNRSSKALPIILISISILALAAVAIIVFYLPYVKDKNAPRMYSIANATNLRSSKDAGGDYNKIRSLPFGSELKTYSNDGEWTEVKDANGEKGFMSSSMLVSKPDFLLLNSIYGDQESRENIETIKCKKALLNYYKNHHYYGKLSSENLNIINSQATVNTTNQWQVFCRAKGLKPNNVFFPRLTNLNSKYTDFAVVIKNISTGERKLLFFSFDDNENSHFIIEQNAPENGFIVNMWNDGYDNIQVQYSE